MGDPSHVFPSNKATTPLQLEAEKSNKTDDEILSSGKIPYAIGLASVVRIPIPGTNGLCIEFKPRGFSPKGGSTSSLFFQSVNGKRYLRLDYGYNVKTKTVDYHWNQKGTFAKFGVKDHQTTGTAGKISHGAAKYFRYGGRVLLVAGVAIDAISVVKANKPLKRATEVVTAWAGCKVVGAGGSFVGSFGGPVGTAVGGVGGCIIGGIGGYFGGEALASEVYIWAEDTVFTPLPTAKAP